MAFRKLSSRVGWHIVRSRLPPTEIVQPMTTNCVRSLDDLVAPKTEVVRFIRDSMVKAGTSMINAEIVGEHLMVADYRGHFSHGLNRMQMYVQDIESKLTDPAAMPEIVNDFQAIALVDGKNALGHIVGKFCMGLAIKKAKEFGIGMVSAKGSNHFGICGYYSMMAMCYDMIGFSCTNSSPLMTPTRSKQSALGSNPLSLGMAANNGDVFLLDMATTSVSLGKIELAAVKGENIPKGWALDKDGQPTTDPNKALESYMMSPLGGAEEHSGYKGYGLALMVEVLCGILSGSTFGPNIRTWKTAHKVADLGQCFLAINPEAFAPGSKDRLSQLLGQLRSLPKVGTLDVLVAGDPERAAMAKVDKEGGIKYNDNQIIKSEKFAAQMGVTPMQLMQRQT